MKKTENLPDSKQVYSDFITNLRKKPIELKNLMRLLRPLFKCRVNGNTIYLKSKITNKSLSITFDFVIDYAIIKNNYVYEFFAPDSKTLLTKLLKHDLI